MTPPRTENTTSKPEWVGRKKEGVSGLLVVGGWKDRRWRVGRRKKEEWERGETTREEERKATMR